MKRIRNKSNIVLLAVFWLLTTSLWAPAGVLAHVTSGLHSTYDQVIDLYTKRASSDACHMDDCPGSVDKVTDCQYVCQYYMETVELSTRPIQTIDTFSVSAVSFIKYPSLAVPERPPKHSG